MVLIKDFAQLSKDFGKPFENYLADTTGPAGTSDGIVDINDAVAFWNNRLQ